MADSLDSLPDEVLLSYLRRLDRGEAVDREALLREHPAHAAALLEYLALEAQLAGPAPAPAPVVSVPSELVGTVVGGAYRVERLLGRGAMGAVYAARHERTGGEFALKVLHQDAAQNRPTLLRFRAEARVASALRHPGIVRVVDLAALPDGSPYLVMEHLHGEDLQAVLQREGRLSLERALAIARQVALALHAAHEHGVVHRDLKPANIFLSRHRDGAAEVEAARVIDFGVAHVRGALAEPLETSADRFIGTPQYASPEAAHGRSALVDGRADQFSLGVILYQLLSGRRPFEGGSVPAVLYQIAYAAPAPLDGVPPAVAAAVARALEKDRERRFPTMLEFAQALAWDGAAGRAMGGRGPRWVLPVGLCGVALGAGAVLWLGGRPGPAGAPRGAAVVVVDGGARRVDGGASGPDAPEPRLDGGARRSDSGKPELDAGTRRPRPRSGERKPAKPLTESAPTQTPPAQPAPTPAPRVVPAEPADPCRGVDCQAPHLKLSVVQQCCPGP